jgi:hypothetical protein
MSLFEMSIISNHIKFSTSAGAWITPTPSASVCREGQKKPQLFSSGFFIITP